MIDSVVNRLNEVIAERLFDKFIESLLGDGKSDGGILAKVGEFLGIGGSGRGAEGGAGGAIAGAATGTGATAAATALTTGATTAATALATGGTTAAAALTTGGTAASTALVAALTAAATSFSAAVIAAGAAFAAAVAGASAAQSGAQFARIIGGAATGLFPAVPGGVVRIVEGGFPEAVLTTDPKHAARQVAILRAFLRETRGLGGRIRGLATGGFAMPDLSLNVPSVSLPSGNFAEMEISSPQATNVRIINAIQRRDLVGGHLRSAEGAHDILNVISEHSDEIGRRIGIK